MHVPLSDSFAPGLYRVTVEERARARTTAVLDLRPGPFHLRRPAHVRRHMMRRNGRAEPIVGTTTMSASVHRDFLFEPNAAVWDDTFAEIASLRINIDTDGIWSGWRKISVDANVVDESFVRALEAFYLTARKHRCPSSSTCSRSCRKTSAAATRTSIPARLKVSEHSSRRSPGGWRPRASSSGTSSTSHRSHRRAISGR